MKRGIIVSLLLFLPFLSGCNFDGVLSFVGGMVCHYVPDSDHCHQWAAVQGGDPSRCAEIKGTKFKDMGSNPPRDKCYMMIAKNSGDYSVCSNIQGGMMSYTKQECLLETALENNDAKGCSELEGYSAEYEQCQSALGGTKSVTRTDKQIAAVIEQLKNDKDNEKLKEALEELKKQRQENYEAMSDTDKQQYFQDQREKIMENIEDADVKSAISKEYISYRNSSGETNINDLLDNLEQITEEQKLLKRLDEDANTMIDQLKGNITDYANAKEGELYDMLKEKGIDRIKKNGGKDLQWSMQKMEWMMDKYEKGSAKYEELMGKYEKFKAAYDEVIGTYERLDKVEKLIAEGKITEGQANVLKGGILLGKGLEYATEYVPVFGSTMSTITKETFETAMKTAEKRAKRTNALDKCIEDPLNCDLDGITGY